MNQKELNRLVQVTIEAHLSEGRGVCKSWVVDDVIDSRAPPLGADADFYTLTARYAVGDIANRTIRGRIRDEENANPAQARLAGYDFVQIAYSVSRDEVPMIVPIASMSDDEIRAKIAELRAMGEGLFSHALDLEKYLDARHGK